MIEIATFCGKPITDMDRDELLKVIEHLAVQLASYQTPQMAEFIALGHVEHLKRGRVSR